MKKEVDSVYIILILQLEVMSRQDIIGLEDLDEEVNTSFWLNNWKKNVKRQGWDSNPRVQSTMD